MRYVVALVGAAPWSPAEAGSHVHSAAAQAPHASLHGIATSAASASGGQIVSASWYGGSGERLSRLTASGELFRPDDHTAASRSLPFGTRVEITYHGRTTIVRVNDRGPAASTGRALDLSRGAAAYLGMIGASDTRVSMRVVN